MYKEDVNRQFEKMYEYSVKPISAEKMDRLGGGYSAEFKYGVLTEEEKDLLISDITRQKMSPTYRSGGHPLPSYKRAFSCWDDFVCDCDCLSGSRNTGC